MNTARRVEIYGQQARITDRMKRRLVKKAGADPLATVIRDTGMGFSAARQGERMLVGYERPALAGVE